MPIPPNSTSPDDEPFKRDYGPGPIGCYSNGGGFFPGFHFERHFRQDPREPQPPIADILLPRLDPVPGYQRADVTDAVGRPRSDMVLPPAAPGDMLDIPGLLARFDATPPLNTDVYAAVKITLDEREATHAGWEKVRAWAHQHFAIERSLAAMLIATES